MRSDLPGGRVVGESVDRGLGRIGIHRFKWHRLLGCRLAHAMNASYGLPILAGGPRSLPTEQPQPRFPPKAGGEEVEYARNEMQAEAVRHARLTGQPGLLICGGSWHGVKAYGGNTETSDGFAEQHLSDMPTCRHADMPTFDDDAPDLRVAHDKVTQRPAMVDPDSMLAAILRPTPAGMPVRMTPSDQPIEVGMNHVHWAHASTETGPDGKQMLSGRDSMSGRATSE